MKARVLAIAATALLAGAACRTAPAPPSSSGRSETARHLLLITIDTLRADHLGAYGYAPARTPAIDALARRGIRFDRAFATAPLTLTSHASLLTGRYPPGHGARNNGAPLVDVPTLATRLRATGFATAAFVAAFPLDRRFGLAPGFDVYSDRLPRGRDGRPADERPGHEVADEAIAWLQAHTEGRTFTWVHFFEPHAPYGPPAGRSRPPIERYDDEIAIADREAGRVMAALGARAASTLIVLAGDHGEAFGEHGEVSHGIFAYDTTLRVPLVMAGPGLQRGRGVVPDAVSLVDVMPTVLAALGLPPADVDGVDLRHVIAGQPLSADRVIYSESFAPLLEFGWSPLRVVRTGRWKFIAAPTPELYDVNADPGEAVSLAASRPEVVAALSARVAGFSGPELTAGQARVPVDAEARRRLEAVGYVGATPGSDSRRRPDPKDRRALAHALALAFSGDLQAASLEDALRAILREDPSNAQAHLHLARELFDADRTAEAEVHFRAATRAPRPSSEAWLGLAQCANRRSDLRGAEAALRQAERLEPGHPVVSANLAILLSKSGRHDEAIARLSRIVAEDPAFDEARFNLALACARAGQRERALTETLELLRRLPPDAAQRSEVERLRAGLEKD